MGWLAPAFLLGMLGIGLPLYLHMLKRHTAKPQPFGSLMFFERREPSLARQRRLKYLLLLALRIVLLALLAFTFADPYFNQATAGAGADRLLVLAIDDSFSMRAGTHLEDAKHAARALVAAKSSGARAQVVALGSQVRLITQPTRDTRELAAAIDSISPSDARASFEVLRAAVRSIAEGEQSPLELHLFSDLQQSGMPPSFAELALPANVVLRLHPLIRTALPNWTVESVSAPAQVWDPHATHVQAVIAGFATPAAARTVSLSCNGRVIATRQVMLGASARAVVQFESLPLSYGISRCAIAIDAADALPADDQYVFTIERIEPRKGLLIHQAADLRSALFFGSALRAATNATVQLDTATLDQAAGLIPGGYSFVVLADAATLPPALNERLERYVRGGGHALLVLGTAAAQARRVPLIGTPILAPHAYSRDRERYVAVGDSDASYPVAVSAAEWSGVRFYYAAALDAAGLRVGLRLADHTPLLAEAPLGEGRVVLFTSGFDNLTNDLPLHPAFVAFVDRLTRYLLGTDTREGARRVDELLTLRTAREQGVGVDVIDPLGQRPLPLKEAAAAQSLSLSRAGFYEVNLASGRHEVIAVNPDRRESDLTPIPDEVLALWSGEAHRSAAATAGGAGEATGRPPAQVPVRLWWYAMVIVLLAAVAESALASRYLGTPREQS